MREVMIWLCNGKSVCCVEFSKLNLKTDTVTRTTVSMNNEWRLGRFSYWQKYPHQLMRRFRVMGLVLVFHTVEVSLRGSWTAFTWVGCCLLPSFLLPSVSNQSWPFYIIILFSYFFHYIHFSKHHSIFVLLKIKSCSNGEELGIKPINHN